MTMTKEKKSIGGSLRGSRVRANSRVELDLLARQEAAEGLKPKKKEEKVKEKAEPKASVPSAEIVHTNGTHAASSDDLTPLTMKSTPSTASVPAEDVAEKAERQPHHISDEGFDFLNRRLPKGLVQVHAKKILGVETLGHLRPLKSYILIDSLKVVSEAVERPLDAKDIAIFVDFVYGGDRHNANTCVCANKSCKNRFFEIRFLDPLSKGCHELIETLKKMRKASSEPVDIGMCAAAANLRYMGPRYLNPAFDPHKNRDEQKKAGVHKWMTFCGGPFAWDEKERAMMYDELSCLGSFGLAMGKALSQKHGFEIEYFWGRSLEEIEKKNRYDAHAVEFVTKRKGGIEDLVAQTSAGFAASLKGGKR